MSYQRWRPGSRRDRRRQAGGSRSRRRTAQSSNRTLFIVLGLFAAALVALFVVLWFTTG